MIEIERKFLINEIPKDIYNCEKQEILQGYFKQNNQTIRVRKILINKKGRKFKKYYLTKKKGKGLVRQEIEKEISEKKFLEYWELAKNNQIKKIRYIYHYKKDIIEINKYCDKLNGLRVAEIEFPSIKDSKKFIPPKWCDKEITDQKEGNNNYMAIYGIKKLIKKNKYEDTITKFQLKEFYNKEAKKYTLTRKKHRAESEKIIKIIKKIQKKEIRIIEIGCGGGRFLEHLKTIKEKNFIYTGVDISENLLEEAKKIKTGENIKTEFICENMTYYLSKQKQEEIDIVIGIASFQHLTTNKQRFLTTKYIYRILKYEGLLIITNRSFSSRMIKKYWKNILKSLFKKIKNRKSNQRNDIFMPWKSKEKIYKRFYHIFTKKELKNILKQSGFIIKKLCYTTKQGNETQDRKKSNNTLVIAKKSIFTH